MNIWSEAGQANSKCHFNQKTAVCAYTYKETNVV